jgi:hypothetical protein
MWKPARSKGVKRETPLLRAGFRTGYTLLKTAIKTKIESAPFKKRFGDGQKAMTGNGAAEKIFVVALDARHFHHFVEAVKHFQLFRVFGRLDIFPHVLAFEPAGKIHRQKPTRNKLLRSRAAEY